MVEGKEAVKETKEFIDKATKCPTCRRKYGDLTISRIPAKTKEEFINYCKEELSNDFGMGLKWLWDFYTGILGKGSERAEAKADEALEQIAELKSLSEGKEKKTIKTLDGKEKVIKR